MRLFVVLCVALLPLFLPLPGGGLSGQRAAPRRQGAALAVAPPNAPTAGDADGSENPELDRAKAPARLPPPRPGAREVVLTFDDGPDLLGTPQVLAELDRRGLKGIFFVTGRNLVGNRLEDLARRDLVRKLAAHGHLVGNHTLSHANLCQLPDMTAELDGNAEIIAQTTGVYPHLFRSPYGARCRRLDEALVARDLVSVGWNMDPQEWKSEAADAVVAYVIGRLRNVRNRCILLLHDTHPAAVRALPRILDFIERENLRIARQKAAGRPEDATPIRIADYGVFLPPRPVPQTGLEPLLAAVAAPFSLIPGIDAVKARLWQP